MDDLVTKHILPEYVKKIPRICGIVKFHTLNAIKLHKFCSSKNVKKILFYIIKTKITFLFMNKTFQANNLSDQKTKKLLPEEIAQEIVKIEIQKKWQM
ncbi:hypothetical protein BpHYR1_003974 [Brachionus plicatilis]|uniref:Uncharacterized protein n=1 Tax=Brachionus plicatilis TaxID=10195 RepID=A0A3M7RXG9_BRAPC|nr:hypothetical protein BpHYR1_003974 [Brachionus plicatilis]